MPNIPLSEGRYLFGRDPLAYANARPDYPEELYKRLRTRCELGPGVSGFEIGAGTGLATRRLLAFGVSPLWVIEPDTRLVGFLRERIPSDSLRVDEVAFEEAKLPEAEFHLGVAATSFHWLDQGSGLARSIDRCGVAAGGQCGGTISRLATRTRFSWRRSIYSSERQTAHPYARIKGSPLRWISRLDSEIWCRPDFVTQTLGSGTGRSGMIRLAWSRFIPRFLRFNLLSRRHGKFF
jgi:hypothetical protein